MKSILFALAALAGCAASAETLGLFAGHDDIGAIKIPGTAAFDAATATYTIGGSGSNTWFRQDAMHYVWKKVSGDVALAATIEFGGRGTMAHRKAMLMLRQSLDVDSAYVDAALHADGLTSLQFRGAKGETTREVQTPLTQPRRLRIEKIGDTAYLSLAYGEGALEPSGCSVRVPFTGEFYVGLGVCSHNADELETVAFSNVELGAPTPAVSAIRSIVETIPIPSGDRRVLYHTRELIEAPNWTRDGVALLFNGSGRIFRFALAKAADGKLIPAGDGRPVALDTGSNVKCNNDHGLSPDGSLLAISDATKPGGSRIYVLPLAGGAPRELTPHAPSYWHGWSPDGRTIAYCAQRDGKYGLFTIPAGDGEEKRLTTADGLDDGPDYSPDGQWIYFNSDRTGRMQVWRIHPDGTGVEQVTRDDLNNWFPHPSPDGKWIVYVTFAADVKGHPRDKDVTLRLMRLATGEITTIVTLFGGQGTMNVPSWSPDSKRIAYVRYQPAQK
ncbi:MAG: hypothetical protein NTY53_07945 [Kiritimatiellaeota bacterium]|nr:hypothetical protein [Kiritimatiellota bacterium]